MLIQWLSQLLCHHERTLIKRFKLVKGQWLHLRPSQQWYECQDCFKNLGPLLPKEVLDKTPIPDVELTY